jgi:hypothetical protein
MTVGMESAFLTSVWSSLNGLTLVVGLLATATQGQNLHDRAQETLDKALSAMADFRRHGGWGVAWSLDQQVVWGEFLPIPDDWITVQSPATPATAGTFLRAGQVLNEPRWIAVANEAHAALCRLQSVAGGLPHEGSPAAGSSKRASFDDGVTTDTLNFFIDWWHHTQNDRDRAAIDRIGAFILTSQYPNSGGWPQSYPPPANYGRCITFNDGNFSNIVSALFQLEQETGDARYREVAIRGGECILKLQGAEGEAIWAQQYDPDSLEPAWARKFEPPGYSPAESAKVCDTLVLLFVKTGDVRYLRALARALKWYKSHKLKNGKYARLYEPNTQRPVYGRRDKAVKVYDFADACTGYAWQGTWYPLRAKRAYDTIQAQGGEAFRAAQAALKEIELRRPSEKTIERICDRLTEAGHWVRQPNSKQLAIYEKNGVDTEIPMVLLRDFNTHVGQLLDYLLATEQL